MNKEQLETHLGKRSGSEYQLNIFREENIFNILASINSESVGVYFGKREYGSHKDEKFFLGLEGMDPTKPIYSSGVHIDPFHQMQGLSGVMFRHFMEELGRLGAINYECFTDMGDERVKPKYMKEGYIWVRTKPDFKDMPGMWYAKEF